jgi:hypothetical protein
MISFQTWEYNNLVRFAAEANQKLAMQQKEIDALKEDLRVAINAYRELIKNKMSPVQRLGKC